MTSCCINIQCIKYFKSQGIHCVKSGCVLKADYGEKCTFKISSKDEIFELKWLIKDNNL